MNLPVGGKIYRIYKIAPMAKNPKTMHCEPVFSGRVKHTSAEVTSGGGNTITAPSSAQFLVGKFSGVTGENSEMCKIIHN